MFLIFFLTLPTTSMIIAMAFACEEFLDGTGGSEKYMLTDMTLSCDDDDAQYNAARGYAMVMWLIFPVGVPLAGYLLLWLRRRDIEKRSSRLGGKELSVLAFYFRSYMPERWQMAFVDMMR